MKKSIIITVIVALFSVMAMNAQKQMDQFEVQVDGLGCPFCAYGLEKKFKELKGIKDVRIEIETGDFSFAYPAEKNLSMIDVKKQVEKAGYTPMTLKVTRANGTVEASEASKSVVAKSGKVTSKSIFVAGNCGMCEARILKAVNSVTGVANAAWDKDTKMLDVGFDTALTSIDVIEKAIAHVGHDTKGHKAVDKTYSDLPGCCKYDRLEQ